jgi:hypothetical protein
LQHWSEPPGADEFFSVREQQLSCEPERPFELSVWSHVEEATWQARRSQHFPASTSSALPQTGVKVRAEMLANKPNTNPFILPAFRIFLKGLMTIRLTVCEK